MELIIRPRQGGKTTEVLRLAARHFAYIVVPTYQDVERLWSLARELQLDIPQPITWQQFIESRYGSSRGAQTFGVFPAGARGYGVKAFIIDDLDRCLDTMTNVPIVGASLSGEVIHPVKPEPLDPDKIMAGMIPRDPLLPDLVPARSTCIKCQCTVEYWTTALGKGWVHVGPERGYIRKDHKAEPAVN